MHGQLVPVRVPRLLLKLPPYDEALRNVIKYEMEMSETELAGFNKARSLLHDTLSEFDSAWIFD